MKFVYLGHDRWRLRHGRWFIFLYLWFCAYTNEYWERSTVVCGSRWNSKFFIKIPHNNTRRVLLVGVVGQTKQIFGDVRGGGEDDDVFVVAVVVTSRTQKIK